MAAGGGARRGELFGRGRASVPQLDEGAGGGIEGAARLRADPRGQREALDRRGADPERRAGRLAVEAGRVA